MTSLEVLVLIVLHHPNSDMSDTSQKQKEAHAREQRNLLRNLTINTKLRPVGRASHVKNAIKERKRIKKEINKQKTKIRKNEQYYHQTDDWVRGLSYESDYLEDSDVGLEQTTVPISEESRSESSQCSTPQATPLPKRPFKTTVHPDIKSNPINIHLHIHIHNDSPD